jgi:DNA (cytosine-5)-methyltransferase 1
MSDVDTTKELQLLSFCTGYGGIERGLELAGVSFRTITHVEIEAFTIANLVEKMEEGRMVSAPIWTNVKTLPLEVFRDRVDILTGGYPCQPFSAAGQRKGAEDPRHLWPHILRAIDVIRPRRVFFENVEGHISLGLQEVIESLEIRGYKTAWGIFSASEVGAPHRRKRVFIMAHTSSERLQGHRRLEQEQVSQGWQGENGHTWPSRPGQKQHEWEEPRTVKSELGGAVDGTRNRVDRLRLLGNGVVPQTAALAWITLNERLI